MDSLVSITDDYLSILLGLPHLSPITILAAFFLTMARLLPILVMAPFLGSKLLPAPIKIMFAISLCAIMLPQILVNLHGNLYFNLAFSGYALKEILIGFILGFLVTVPFYIAQASGNLIDHIRGSSSLQVTDPTTSMQTSPIGIFYNYVLIAVFFGVGGPFLFIEAIIGILVFFSISVLSIILLLKKSFITIINIGIIKLIKICLVMFKSA